jgi:hypothetical protein
LLPTACTRESCRARSARECDRMKKAVEDLFSIVPPGGIVVYARAVGMIEKGQEVVLIPGSEHSLP